jgi:TRAP-type C4-dicarboxylate transport system permease small subunit
MRWIKAHRQNNLFKVAIYRLSEWFDRVACLCLVIMVLVAVLNVGLRVIGIPMQGAVELTSFLSALVMGFSLSYCIIAKGHISVQILIERLPEPLRKVTHFTSSVLTTIVLATMSWATGNLAIDMWNQVSVILKIYFAPLIGSTSICCLLGALIVVEDILRSLTSGRETG